MDSSTTGLRRSLQQAARRAVVTTYPGNSLLDNPYFAAPAPDSDAASASRRRAFTHVFGTGLLQAPVPLMGSDVALLELFSGIHTAAVGQVPGVASGGAQVPESEASRHALLAPDVRPLRLRERL